MLLSLISSLTLATLPTFCTPQLRLGPLTPQAVRVLRHIKDFFGVQFSMRTEQASQTVFMSCIGAGLKNLARKTT